MKYGKLAMTFGLSLALVFGMALSARPAAAQTAPKIGVVDIQRALNDSKKGKAAKAKLQSQFERMQKELGGEEKELQRLEDELKKQIPTLTPEAADRKQKDLRNRVRNFQDKYRDFTDKMKRDEYESTQPVLNEIIKIIREMGKERGYSLIMELKSGVIYAPDALDITADVVKKLDS